ncbi:MAG: hypothetical protein HQK57_05295 [Deltaproteobacteria bacterium]|nr:hypothetical protein [Deltaproteobacteria bacterium]
MGTITFKYADDQVMVAVKEFLLTLPPHSIEIILESSQEWDHIPYVSAEEQAEIEEILKDPECHVIDPNATVRFKL